MLNSAVQLITKELINAGLLGAEQEEAIKQVLLPISEKLVIRPSEEAILQASQDVALSEYCSEMPELTFEQLIAALESGEFPCTAWEAFEDYRAEDFARILRSAQGNVMTTIENLFAD
jgi:hypothetical protein